MGSYAVMAVKNNCTQCDASNNIYDYTRFESLSEKLKNINFFNKK